MLPTLCPAPTNTFSAAHRSPERIRRRIAPKCLPVPLAADHRMNLRNQTLAKQTLRTRP